MGYVVIHRFADTQDMTETKGGSIPYIYEVGDEFPRSGKRASKGRIEELTSSNNKPGLPLIEYTEKCNTKTVGGKKTK